MDYSVQLEGVTKRFGETVAVDNVSFGVRKGEFFCLIGPSGSGKTTTLRLIAGLIRPDSGKIIFNGVDYTQVPTYKRPLSMVFQTWALFPHMSVFDNVAFGLKMRGYPQDRIKEEVKKALELVRMSEYAHRKPRELSGGQQQRVAIARALVVRPEIILLDEPLGNLDFKLQLQLQTELSQLHKQLGITFIYVTHDQRQAMALGNRICVMNNGRVEQLDTNERLYSYPTNVFVAKFVGESNIVEGKIVRVDSDAVEISTPLGNFKLNHSVGPANKVWLFWRPEKTLIGTEAKNVGRPFRGTVKSVQTSGQVTQYVVDVNNLPIKVVKTGLPDPEIIEGSETMVGVRNEDLLVLDKLSISESADLERTILGA